MIKDTQKRKIYSWALYDWANSAFATTIMAAFFPIFFKKYWSAGVDVTQSTLQLGMANSIATIIVACVSPILGAIADCGSSRKKFLFFFTYMGIVMTLGLFWVSKGDWMTAILLYVIAQIGYVSSLTFYDSLLLNITTPEKRDYVSSFGYALGYLGGGLLFAVNVAMTLKPELFGIADAGQAVRISFISVGIWWAIFSVPVFLFVKETVTPEKVKLFDSISSGFSQLRDTFKELRKYRVAFHFLIAYWFYIDGVDTIIRMIIDYGMSIGFNSDSLIVALLLTQFVGFPSAILFGKLGERIGTKVSIFIAIAVYFGICLWGPFIQEESEIYIVAIAIGLVQGGVQSLSRSFFSRLIPESKVSQFFGFYNMLGKFAVVIGPVLMGYVAVITGSSRFSLFSITVLFLIGGIILYFVDEEKGREAANLGEEHD